MKRPSLLVAQPQPPFISRYRVPWCTASTLSTGISTYIPSYSMYTMYRCTYVHVLVLGIGCILKWTISVSCVHVNMCSCFSNLHPQEMLEHEYLQSSLFACAVEIVLCAYKSNRCVCAYVCTNILVKVCLCVMYRKCHLLICHSFTYIYIIYAYTYVSINEHMCVHTYVCMHMLLYSTYMVCVYLRNLLLQGFPLGYRHHGDIFFPLLQGVVCAHVCVY